MAEQHLNSAGTHVYVHNPETGGDWECPVDYLPVALVRGFELAEPPDTSLDGLVDPGIEPKKKAAKSGAKDSGDKPES